MTFQPKTVLVSFLTKKNRVGKRAQSLRALDALTEDPGFIPSSTPRQMPATPASGESHSHMVHTHTHAGRYPYM